MRKNAYAILLTMAALALLSGCGVTKSQFREPSYTQPVEKGMVLRQYTLDPSVEEKILALDPERVKESDVREVLSHAPAPRVINIHGGIYPVYLCMESFSQFLIGMGYPEGKIRNPGNGSFSFSCYESSAKIAGAIAWYYEKEGMRPMLVGHSQGGIQAVKVLYELKGAFSNEVAVYNPLTGKFEKRYSIIDPITGAERPVVGLEVSYATAVGAGGFTRFLPNQWVMTGRLRSIPDTTLEFTGFVIGLRSHRGRSVWIRACQSIRGQWEGRGQKREAPHRIQSRDRACDEPPCRESGDPGLDQRLRSNRRA